jgi:hypothetical protein
MTNEKRKPSDRNGGNFFVTQLYAVTPGGVDSDGYVTFICDTSVGNAGVIVQLPAGYYAKVTSSGTRTIQYGVTSANGVLPDIISTGVNRIRFTNLHPGGEGKVDNTTPGTLSTPYDFNTTGRVFLGGMGTGSSTLKIKAVPYDI